MKKFVFLLAVLVLLIPAVSADVVSELWTDTPYASDVVASDMSASGDNVVFGYANGHVVFYNSVGDKLWDTTPFGEVNIDELVIPAKTSSYVYARFGTNVSQLSTADGTTAWTKTVDSLLDWDVTANGDKLVFMTLATLETIDATNAAVGSIVWDKDSTGTSGTWKQAIIDPDGDWVVGIQGDAAGTVNLYDYVDRSTQDWLPGYTYRREHRITGSPNGYLENYGVNFTVHRANGVTSGENVYLGADIQEDFDDIRFVVKSSGELLQHAKVGSASGNAQNFTVKIPYLSQNQQYDIYVYYGNGAAVDISNSAGILYEDIGYLNVLSNPSFETSDSWTYSTLTSSFASGSGSHELPDTDWYTDGSGSVYLTGSVTARPYDSGSITVRVGQQMNTQINGSFGVYVTADGQVTSDPGTYYYWGDTSVQLIGHTASSMNPEPGIPVELSVTLAPGETLYAAALVYTNDRHTGSVNIDNLRFKRWIQTKPAHDSWSQEQQKYSNDVEYKTQVTLDSAVVNSDMAWSGDVFVASTSSRINQITVTGSTTLTKTYTTVTGTQHVIKSASGGNYFVEGRGTYFYLYRYTPTLDSSFSFGNSVDIVDIAETTGDWAVAGSDDGTLKVFSKINSSSWYFAWSTTPIGEPGTATFSERGSFFAYGEKTTGTINFYSTTQESIIVPDIYTTIHTYRDGSPFAGAYVDVYYGGDYGSTYVVMETNKRTDSDGEFVLFGITEHYYRVDVKDASGEVLATKIIQISRTDYDKNIYIYIGITPYDETLTHVVSYGAQFDDDSDDIIIRYNDTYRITESVTFKVYRISPTSVYTEMYSNTWYGTNEVIDTFTDTEVVNSYRVDITFVRGGQEFTESIVCVPLGKWHVDFPIPPEIRVACFAILLLCIISMFPPDYRGLGAITGMGFNTYFFLIGALPNPWWLISIGWIAAMFYMAGRVQEGGL
jgi:hypothetical protein